MAETLDPKAKPEVEERRQGREMPSSTGKMGSLPKDAVPFQENPTDTAFGGQGHSASASNSRGDVCFQMSFIHSTDIYWALPVCLISARCWEYAVKQDNSHQPRGGKMVYGLGQRQEEAGTVGLGMVPLKNGRELTRVRGLPGTFRGCLQFESLNLQWHQPLGKYTSSSWQPGSRNGKNE